MEHHPVVEISFEDYLSRSLADLRAMNGELAREGFGTGPDALTDLMRAWRTAATKRSLRKPRFEGESALRRSFATPLDALVWERAYRNPAVRAVTERRF